MNIEPQTAEPTPVRDRLLDAAEQVIGREGVSHLTLDAVAHQAGVSKGGLLYHFPSKSALITGIVERLASRCEAEQQRDMENDARRPGAFSRAFLAARAKEPDPHRSSIELALLAAAGTHPDYLEPLRALLGRWQQRLEQDGIDAEVATIVRLAADGLALARLLKLAAPTGELRQKVIDKLTAMTTSPQGGESQS